MTLPSNPRGWLNPCTSLSIGAFFEPALRFHESKKVELPMKTTATQCVESVELEFVPVHKSIQVPNCDGLLELEFEEEERLRRM